MYSDVEMQNPITNNALHIYNHLSCDIQWMVERSQSLHGKRRKKVEAPWQAQEEALHWGEAW